MKKGLFQPPPQAPADDDYRGLQQLVGEALEALQKVTPAEVNALEGKDVVEAIEDDIRIVSARRATRRERRRYEEGEEP